MDRLFQLHQQPAKWLAFESNISTSTLLLYVIIGVALLAVLLMAVQINRHLSKPYPFKKKSKKK